MDEGNSSGAYAGIDFGTSKSAVAWYNPRTRQAEILKNAEEQDATPSAVYFGEGETLVGQGALNILEDAADDGNLEMAGRVWINVKRDLAGGAPRLIGERVVQPKDVATAIFAKLKRDAEKLHFHHQPVRRAVVTCPASFDVVQRDEIKKAARAAGLLEVALLDEPVAAALAYAEMSVKMGQRVLVYDLGGGTFDLAVLARDSENGSFRVALPPAGLPDCGGNAFDLALYEYCRRQATEAVARELGEGSGLGTPVSRPFLQRCRECKEALTFTKEATLSALVPVAGRLERFKVSISRATFEGLIADKVDATVRLTLQMEQQARQDGQPVDTIVLVGSSAKIPLVERLLSEHLDVDPRRWEKQGIAVALGAAYYAHRLWGREEKQDDSLGNGTQESTTGTGSTGLALRSYRGRLQRALQKGANNLPQLDTAIRKLGLDPQQAESVEREVLGETVVERATRLVRGRPMSPKEQYRELLRTVQSWGAEVGPQLRSKIDELGLAPAQADEVEREVLGETVTDDRRSGEETTEAESQEPKPELTGSSLEVVMPRLRADEPVGVIRRWLQREGAPVGKGQSLVEVETDRVLAEVGAPMRGVVDRILEPEGARVPFGQPIVTLRRDIQSKAGVSFSLVHDVRAAYKLSYPARTSPTGNLFVVGSHQKAGSAETMVHRLLVYRLPDARQVGTLMARPFTVVHTSACAFSSDGQLVAEGGPPITVWEVSSGRRIAVLNLSRQFKSDYLQTYMVFHSRDRLFTWSGDKRVMRWDVDTKTHQPLLSLESLIGLDVLPGGRLLLTATAGGERNAQIDLWDVDTGTHVRTVASLASSEMPAGAMAVSRDGRLVALSQRDMGAHVWDVETGDLVRQLSLAERVVDLTFSPDGSLLALQGSRVSVWALASGEEVFSYPNASLVGFSPDSRLLVALPGRDVPGGGDRVTVWERT